VRAADRGETLDDEVTYEALRLRRTSATNNGDVSSQPAPLHGRVFHHQDPHNNDDDDDGDVVAVDDDDDDNNNKWSKDFDERPHGRRV